MTAPLTAAASTELSPFDNVVLAISSPSQARFLSSLPQLQASTSPTWVLGPGVSPNGLNGRIDNVDRTFGRGRSMLASRAEARDLLRDTDASLVLVGSGPLALPYLLAARDQEIRSIFFESPEAPTGRRSLVARLADSTVVEWEHQLTRHPFATVLGETL